MDERLAVGKESKRLSSATEKYGNSHRSTTVKEK
jgi:hypothetical protein